jgi:AcrR family transcriptional regulator
MINQMLTDHSTRQSADTREKILQAAFTVLSRQGYENTSIKDIAEEAGVAQGLVHYHYKSRQQLVLAVLEFVCHKVELGVVEGEAGARRAFEDTKTSLKDSREANSLYIELIGVGLHDALVGAGIREFIRSERTHIAELAGQVLAERGQPGGQARGIAGVVWAAVLGIMIQSLVDPEFDADEAIDTLAAMSLSAVFTAAPRAQV